MRFKENDQLDVALYEEHARNYVLKTNYQRPLLITRAEGVRFWDQHGRSYLDFMSKAVCVSLGFGRREITEALHQQLDLGSFHAGNSEKVLTAQPHGASVRGRISTTSSASSVSSRRTSTCSSREVGTFLPT